jgi:hypothetical protein
LIHHARTPEQKEYLVRYLAAKIGMEPQDLVGQMPFHMMASVVDDRLMGAVLVTNYRRQSVECHLAGEPGWVTRKDLRDLFSYPFVTLGCSRLWCVVARNNKRARKFTERCGFNVKAVLDDEFGQGKDGIFYSMNRSDCKWLA